MSVVAPEVTEARELLESRLSTLELEKAEIEESIAALPTNGSVPTRRRPGRPRKAASPPRKSTSRKGRGKTRKDQALDLVTKAGDDGISASDIAGRLKMKPNYLYRVMKALEKEKLVRKKGRTYFPVAASPAS